jgi:hypothetical protein
MGPRGAPPPSSERRAAALASRAINNDGLDHGSGGCADKGPLGQKFKKADSDAILAPLLFGLSSCSYPRRAPKMPKCACAPNVPRSVVGQRSNCGERLIESKINSAVGRSHSNRSQYGGGRRTPVGVASPQLHSIAIAGKVARRLPRQRIIPLDDPE